MSKKEYVIRQLFEPWHVGETEHGFSIFKKKNGFYLKHSSLYAKPGGTSQYREEITPLSKKINTKSELYMHIRKTYGYSFFESCDDNTTLASLFS